MENNTRALAIGESFSFVDATPKSITYLNQTYDLKWKCVGCEVYAIKLRSNEGLGWWQQDEDYGLHSDGIRLIFTYNNGYAREAQVVVYVQSNSTGEETSYIFKINQRAGRPLFEVSQTYVTESDTGGSTGLYLNLNSDRLILPNISSNVDWITGDIEYTGIDSTLNVNVEQNIRFQKRYGKLILSYTSPTTKDWEIPQISYTQEITVEQEENQLAPSIIFNVDKVDLNPDGVNQVYRTPYRFENYAYIISSTTTDNFYTYELTEENGTKYLVVRPTGRNITEEAYTGKITFRIGNTEYPDYEDFDFELPVEQLPLIPYALNPQRLQFTYQGEPAEGSNNATTIIPFSEAYSIIGCEVVPDPEEPIDWVTSSWSGGTNTLFISVVENVDTYPRIAQLKLKVRIEFVAEAITAYTYTYLDISQDASPEYVENPIWKDTLYTLDKETYSTYNLYRIVDADTLDELYRGRLFFINDTIDINVTDIAKDYFKINKYPFDNTFTNNNGYVNITLEISADKLNWEPVQVYHFYYNYDYDYDKWIYDLKTANITNPIQNYVDNRQYFIWSFQDYYSSSINTASTTPIFIDYDYTDKTVEDSYTIYNAQNTLCTKVTVTRMIHIGTPFSNIDIEVKETCADYCLYYINKQGGWSWLLINGNNLKNSKITTNNYNQNVNNSLSSNFGNVQYLKQIKESWKLYTEYLNDEQSEKMEDLLMSPVVYLHLLNEDRLIAVTIDETSVDLKTFQNQKNKPYQYTFTVNNSQMKYRR